MARAEHSNALLSAWREVAQEEFPLWLQAFRTMAAMLLALAIAFRLDLSSPSSAAVTVAVISLPQSGMVLEKSFYRLLATFGGGLVTLLLIAVFAQQRDLFIVMVALWIGVCAALSAWYRNFQSYGWALAGYTACLIGFPAYEHADNAFAIVVDRVSIVALGILCGGVVNATLFPHTSSSSLVQSVRRSFRDFVGAAQSALRGYASHRELHQAQRRFLFDILALESTRASSFFEDPESRVRTPRLRRFISQYMVAATTAHAINRLREDLAARDLQRVLQALEPLHEEFLRSLHTESAQPPAAAVEAVVVVGQLQALLQRWDEHALAARERLAVDASAAQRDELDSALNILREFVEEARDFAETYAELRAPSSALDRIAAAAPAVRADHLSALIAGARAALTLIALCVFWIVSGWPDGFSAALLGAVACTLFVNAPAPANSVWQMVRGFMLGFVAAFVCFTFVLPALDGLTLLIAGLTPFLMVGTYLLARPQTAGLGAGYCMMFLVSLSITANMQYDIVALLNGGVAQIVGVMVAAVAFAIVFPANTAWHNRRIEKTLWRELAVARRQPLAGLRHRFESGVRDLGLQYLNLARSDDERRRRLAVCMTLLEAGRALLALRACLQQLPANALAAAIERQLDALTAALVTTSAAAVPASTAALQHLLQYGDDPALELSPSQRGALRTALQMLSLAVRERGEQLRLAATAAEPEVADAA